MDRQYELLELAMMALATGNATTAAMHCEASLKLGLGDAWLYKTYATALLLLDRLDEAEEASRSLHRLAGGDPKFEFDSGIVSGEIALRRSRSGGLRDLEQLARAEADLSRATSLLDHAGKYGRCLAGALHAEALLDLGRENDAHRVIEKVRATLRGTTLEGRGILEEQTRETNALANVIKRAAKTAHH